VTFRSKLFWMFTVALIASVVLIAAGVTVVTRQDFEKMYAQHTDALVAQFQREFDQRKHDVARQVQIITDEDTTVRMAIGLAQPQADVSAYVNVAKGVAQSHQLDFVDFVGSDGSIISSAENPERFGYKLEWVVQPQDWPSVGAFLKKIDTENGPAIGLLAVSTVRVGDKNLYIVGGERLGKDFLGSLVQPVGMRALLYLNMDSNFQSMYLLDQEGPVIEGDRFAQYIDRERDNPAPDVFKIASGPDLAQTEEFHALPLLGRQKELLGVLLVGSSQQEMIGIERRIRMLAESVVAIGLLISLLLSWWGAARVTRPVRRLAGVAREVSEGNWNARVEEKGGGEVGQLARAFNQMTSQLKEQREHLIQAERVAAWRELARRLAHELKNPLFPLQTTVENLQRAKSKSPEQFEEVFRESTGILLAEIENLEKIIGRFSDFAKMPQPELAPVNLNEIVRGAVKLFEAQFSAVGRPPITPEFHLAEDLPPIQADAALLRRAIENLILNAMDAMPAGGVLMLRTTRDKGEVHLEVSDTGTGLTPEECDRLFTPYYTTKQHGTGLGLAVVQSVISDHGGRISVESEMGIGTSFHIFLPVKPGPRPVAPAPAPVAPAETSREILTIQKV
jgi:two-component system, NtrC family, nitrogen regulation sensor histidine kinase NtrY